MTCIRIPGGILTVSGPTLRIIAGNGQEFLFEWHYYAGPSTVTKSGEIKKTQPGQRSPFWEAVTYWHEQGKRTRGEYAVWHYPAHQRPIARHITKNHYKVIGHRDIPSRPGWPADLKPEEMIDPPNGYSPAAQSYFSDPELYRYIPPQIAPAQERTGEEGKV